jgi:hypothetical protein
MDEPKDPKYPCLSWTDLQPMLEKADIDRLLLFDCCYAAAAVQKISTKSTMEIIASCGREVECAGPKWGGPEKSPFTATLIEVLKKMASRPNGLLAAELQTFLSIHGVLNNQSPNHCVIEGHRRPILLKPLAPTKDESESDQASPAMVAAELNVLIAISFRGDTSVTAEEMANWLGDYQLPNEVVGIEVRSVVESIYESCSTLMEVSIPLWLWALLPDIPGCFFVGFLKSRNLISQFPNLRKEVSKQRTPGTPISSESIDRSIANEHLLKWVIRNDDEQQSGRWSSDPTEVGDEDIGALLAVKQFKYLTNLDLQTRQSNLVLDRTNIQLKSEIDIHSLALLEPTSELVLVEWLGYQESWADGVINTELLRRLTSVAGLLHSQSTSQILGSLNCQGVFRDSSRQAFGIVYSLPAGGTQPVTLHRLLSSSDRPPLEYRFRLAFNICRFINTFHEVGWLHCNLHSMNLLLFPPEGAENAGWVGEPRILGFVGSRENHHSSFTLGPDDTELGLYQHPDYLERRGRYREEFDYYSVGMLLLEIGFWSTLSKITASNRFRTLSPKEFTRAVIMARVPKLAITMGTGYMEATRTCLEGGLLGKPGDSGDGKYAWRASFKSLVMDQISLSEVTSL